MNHIPQRGNKKIIPVVCLIAAVLTTTTVHSQGLGVYTCTASSGFLTSSPEIQLGTGDGNPWSLQLWGEPKVVAPQVTANQAITSAVGQEALTLLWKSGLYYNETARYKDHSQNIMGYITSHYVDGKVQKMEINGGSGANLGYGTCGLSCYGLTGKTGLQGSKITVNVVPPTGFTFSLRLIEVLTKQVELPLPPNEYSDMTYTFTAPSTTRVVTKVLYGMTPGPGAGEHMANLTQVPTMTCTRNATPLELRLQEVTLDFNNIQIGATSPVTRELHWNASGTGQAPIWTMTFDTDKKDGNDILLGTSRIKIMDANKKRVPLGTGVGITGVSGAFIFELDPTSATPSIPEDTNVTITLTAN